MPLVNYTNFKYFMNYYLLIYTSKSFEIMYRVKTERDKAYKTSINLTKLQLITLFVIHILIHIL